MKIIQVGTAYPMRGGIAQYVALLFQELSKQNEVKVFSFKRQYPEFLFPGKTQYETGEPALKVPDDKNVIAIDSINPFNWIFTGLKMRKENADLIIYKYWIPFFAIQYSVISFFAKVFRKTKVMYICDNVIPHERRFADILLTKIAFLFVDYFLVQSKTVEAELKQLNKKNKPYILTPHPIYNIFGDIVEKNKSAEIIGKKYNINLYNKKILLFFGYIRKYKGLINIIEAMSIVRNKYPEALLLVAGEFYEDSSPYYSKIKDLKLEDNVSIVSDFIPDEDVKYFFSVSDSVVLPYSSASQSGIVQIAYHFNKPVIASKIGGIGEVIVEGKTGLLVPPDNHDMLAGAILNFYENNLEQDFIKGIISEKEKYSWQTYTNKIYNLVKLNK